MLQRKGERRAVSAPHQRKAVGRGRGAPEGTGRQRGGGEERGFRGASFARKNPASLPTLLHEEREKIIMITTTTKKNKDPPHTLGTRPAEPDARSASSLPFCLPRPASPRRKGAQRNARTAPTGRAEPSRAEPGRAPAAPGSPLLSARTFAHWRLQMGFCAPAPQRD